MRDIKIEGKLSDANWTRLLKITELVNVGMLKSEHKTPERVLWDLFCTALDDMERQGHNRVLYLKSDFINPLIVQERVNKWRVERNRDV